MKMQDYQSRSPPQWVSCQSLCGRISRLSKQVKTAFAVGTSGVVHSHSMCVWSVTRDEVSR